MIILDEFRKEEVWQKYLLELKNKSDLVDKKIINNVKSIIESKSYKTVDLFDYPLPRKVEVPKDKHSGKTRTVYTYPEPYGTYLRIINWLLQKADNYRNSFAFNSYAYQQNKSVGRAIKRVNQAVLNKKYEYYIKTDFKDYFNQIDLQALAQEMNLFFREEDSDLVELFNTLLSEPKVRIGNKIVEEDQKGVMAGTPISGYLANVYLNQVDHSMHSFYMRYADDVLILTNDIEKSLSNFTKLLEPYKVSLNERKTETGEIKDGFEVLGFKFDKGQISIGEEKVQKMMNRIKRRAKWFRVWQKKNNVNSYLTTKTFVKGMNVKFFQGDFEDRVNWSKWYFSGITNVDDLKRIDKYMQQKIRYIMTGKEIGYKKSAEVEYKKLKQVGYRTLVNSYYKYKKGELKI